MLQSTMQGLESAIEIGDTATVQKILDVVPEQTLCEMRNHGTFPKATFCPSFSEKDVLEECVGTAVAYNWIDIVDVNGAHYDHVIVNSVRVSGMWSNNRPHGEQDVGGTKITMQDGKVMCNRIRLDCVWKMD